MQQTSHPRRTARLRSLVGAAAVLALGACATRTPAPIVPRTTPQAESPRPAAPAPAPAAPRAPAPAVPPPEAPVVQTAPVRPPSIESRGIESRPLDPVAPPAAPPVAAPVVPGTVLPPAAPALPPNTRTGPRGTKVPYSDSALAELRAAEAQGAARPGAAAPPSVAPPAAAAAPAAAATPGAPADPKAEAKAETRAADGSGGAWAWPVGGSVVQSFEQSSGKGIVLAGKLGDPVLAAADGRVIFSGNGPRGYGNLVIVKHDNDLLSVYAHNRSLAVKEGEAVKRGQKIAELGQSGTSSPRLHFEIRQQGKPVDPARYLPRR
jgi:lipoprotein NlpD